MINFAIIGTSKISHVFLEAALQVKDFHLSAVYSRTQQKANEFAQQYKVTRLYTSLTALASDPVIDVVYIASPNKFHAEQAIQMLNAGKHVLCEKPVATTLDELKSMLEAAQQNNVILLEAMRSVFDPGFEKIQELLSQLGEVRRATFSFSKISSRFANYKNGIIENAFNPSLGNAAIMDIGVYCIQPMVALFGLPKSVTAQSIFLENRMEALGNVTAFYDTMIGQISYSKITDSHLPCEIEGENGTMIIDHIPEPRKLTMVLRNGKPQEYYIEKNSNNMYYEVDKLIHFIKKKKQPLEYNQWSLWEMEVLDKSRFEAGINEF